MRPLISTLLTLVCCSGSLLADPGPAAPGNPVVDIQREAALASREVYYNLRELPGSTQLYRVLYTIHGYSSGIQVPCQRDYLILDEMVHEAEFILDRMQVPAGPVCAYQRRCAPVKPLPSLEHVSVHVLRLRELVDLTMLPPGKPEIGPGQHSEKQPIPKQHVPEVIPGKNIPQDNVPENYVPQEIPGKHIPQEIPGKNIPQEIPGKNIPQEVPGQIIPNEVPKQYEEIPEGPGVVIPGSLYPDKEEIPLNPVPQPNPTDVLITPNQPFDVSVSSPQRENARPNTNPDLNRDEFLPEVLVVPQSAESGPVLVTP